MSMFNSNDFLKLIQEGKISPDTITKDFTEALNAALAAKKQADEAARKQREADDIAARINAFMKTHYADVAGEVTGAQFVEALDASMGMIRGLKNMACDKKVHDFFSHDPIMDFLRDNKLL